MSVSLTRDAFLDAQGNLCNAEDAVTILGRAGSRPLPDDVAIRFGIKGNPDYDAAAVKGKAEAKAVESPPENKGLSIDAPKGRKVKV